MYTALLKFIFLKICVVLTLNSHEQRLLNLLKKKERNESQFLNFFPKWITSALPLVYRIPLHFQNISPREKLQNRSEIQFNRTFRMSGFLAAVYSNSSHTQFQ